MFKELVLLSALSLSVTALASETGETVFRTYCAACHGSEGAGLVGPNLTDAEVLHGSSISEIAKVVSNGVPGKSMPAWETLLSKDDIESVAAFVKSIMGKNLPSPMESGESTVSPFPEGTLTRPLLVRTFMPKMGLSDDVFANHYDGRPTPKYSPGTGTFDANIFDLPIDGIPAAIAVNFGEKLSYCFDSTECRLLYTWDGPFLDMTKYWGAGPGGGRKSFDYVSTVMSPVNYLAAGQPLVLGKPRFKGYRKVNSVPEFMYSIGEVELTQKITPGEEAGVAVCEFTTSGVSENLVLQFDSKVAEQISCDAGEFVEGKLILSPADAKAFSITISPKRITP